MSEKCETASIGGYANAGTSPRRPNDDVHGIEITFLSNGFLASPRLDYIGTHRSAHVARTRDELLKLIGEMIDAHAPK
jgi:hypothetical protein